MFIEPAITPAYFSYLNTRSGEPILNTPVLDGFKGKMYPFWYENCRITWFPRTSWINPQYNIYRSGSENGPFTKLNAAPVTGNTYNDFTTNMASKYAHDLYYVEVISNGNIVGRSEIIKNERKLEMWHQLRAVEINRREWILLTRFSGMQCILLKHVKYGKYNYRCPECWDDVNKLVRKDRCTTCYGTSYEGGYYKGIPTMFQFDNEPNKEDALAPEGIMEPADTTAWTIAYPEIDVNDLIVRVDDYRIFRVQSVQNTSLRSYIIRQMVRVTNLPFTDIEYKLLEREEVLDA